MSTKGNDYVKDSVLVPNLMQMKIEEIKAKLDDDFTANVNESSSPHPMYPDYVIAVTESVNWDTNPYIKNFRVDVNWTNSTGMTSQESMYFLKADY